MVFVEDTSKKTLKNDLLDELKLLTPKEYETYKILMQGYKLKETADKLNVKFTTINEHTKSIYKKLGVHTQKELMVKYLPVFISEEVKN